MGVKLLDKRNINYLKSNNQKVIAWTINKEDEMKTLIKMGVDGIMTDNLSSFKKCSYRRKFMVEIILLVLN